MLLLLNLVRRYWRESAIGALVIAVMLVAAGWARDRNALARAQLVYLHPQTRSVEKIVKIQGPVQIVTRTVEKPGEKVTVIVESHGPVTETTGTEQVSAPVPIAVAMAPARTDRWLLGAQVDDGRFHEGQAYTALAGYSFRNRLDVLAGGGGDGFKLQAVVRF